MNAWDNLPNAQLIDQVLASVKAHPDQWAASTAAYDSAYHSAYNAAYDSAYVAAYVAARDAARGAAYVAAGDAARGAAYIAACDALIALVAYDDSAKFLDMSSSELEVRALLSHNPAAVLLLPAVKAFELIKQQETACVTTP